MESNRIKNKLINLDDLPKKGGDHKYSGKIDWIRSVGSKIKFIYEDIEDEIEVVDYKDDYVTVQYKEKIKKFKTINFTECKIGVLIGKIKISHLFTVGEIITDIKYGELNILEQIRMGKSKTRGYRYKCLICNNHDSIREDHLKNKHGCNVCSGKKVLKGINDMWTTHPETAELLWNSEDGFSHSIGSGKRVDWRCIECHLEIKSKVIVDVVKYGLSCPRCGDGISYPNKFTLCFLQQLGVEFDYEKSFKFSNGKRYDFYVSSLSIIIEINGLQHYSGNFSACGGRTLEEEEMNDKNKKDLALENEVKHYIVIDCRHSELEWIKKSIQESDLNTLFDLSKINWMECHKFACSSVIKIVCDLWRNGMNRTKLISDELKINRTSITKYLKRGAKIGWCDYDAEIAMKNKASKEVVRISTDNVYMDEFESGRDASRKVSVNYKNILEVCDRTHLRETAGGFKWIFKKDYEERGVQ